MQKADAENVLISERMTNHDILWQLSSIIVLSLVGQYISIKQTCK